MDIYQYYTPGFDFEHLQALFLTPSVESVFTWNIFFYCVFLPTRVGSDRVMKWFCCMREQKGKKGKGGCQKGDVACLCTDPFGSFQLFTSLCKADIFWRWGAAMGLCAAMCLVNAWGEQGKILASTTLPVHDWASPLRNKNRCRNNILVRSSLQTDRRASVNGFMLWQLKSGEKLPQLKWR